MSAVHINRSLQILRKQGLITWNDGRLTVMDVEKLKEFADFTVCS